MNRKERRSGGQGPFPRTKEQQAIYDLAMLFCELPRNPILDLIWKEAKKCRKSKSLVLVQTRSQSSGT